MNEQSKKERLLLACDLDRTVLPNGKEPLSDGATDAFKTFTADGRVILAYLSGRNLALIKDAIRQYDIPVPDIAVGDVGTSMYFKHNEFMLHDGWSVEIASDWGGKDSQYHVPRTPSPSVSRGQDHLSLRGRFLHGPV